MAIEVNDADVARRRGVSSGEGTLEALPSVHFEVLSWTPVLSWTQKDSMGARGGSIILRRFGALHVFFAPVKRMTKHPQVLYVKPNNNQVHTLRACTVRSQRTGPVRLNGADIPADVDQDAVLPERSTSIALTGGFPGTTSVFSGCRGGPRRLFRQPYRLSRMFTHVIALADQMIHQRAANLVSPPGGVVVKAAWSSVNTNPAPAENITFEHLVQKRPLPTEDTTTTRSRT